MLAPVRRMRLILAFVLRNYFLMTATRGAAYQLRLGHTGGKHP